MKRIYLLSAVSFFFGIISQVVPADALVIYYDDGNSGESSMVRGISKVFAAQTQEAPELVTFVDEKESQALTIRLKGVPDTLLLVGKDVFSFLNEEGEELRQSGWKLAHLNHQVCDEHSETISHLDMCFLPGYLELGVAENGTIPDLSKVTWINGVPYDLDHEKIEEAYKDLGLPDDGRYVVVYLGGDAPDEKGVWSRYTPEEAVQLVSHVQATEPDSTFIVINGPRTGKYSTSMEVIEGIHRDAAPTDAVTQAVADKLRGQPHKIIDFRFGEKSMYQPALSLVMAGKAKLFAPGESNSVITDIVALGLQPQTTVFTHGAMNKSHKANVEYARRNQGITYVNHEENFRSYTPESTESRAGETENPNEQVVRGLMRLM